MKRTLTLIYLSLIYTFASAQLNITDMGVAETIDFTGFAGEGFSATPTAGQLSTQTWAVEGFSDGNVAFSGEAIDGDYSRGTTTGFETTGGIYAADIAGNQRLFVQPVAADFSPGSFTLRVRNMSGLIIGKFEISYAVYAINNEDRANNFTLSYSLDNISYTELPEFDFTSPELADDLEYSLTPSGFISALSIADGDYFYIRFTGDDVSGADSRDEFMLDDISVTAFEAPPLSVYSFSPPAVIVDESAGVASYNVGLSESADCVFNVHYTEISADNPTDFTISETTVTFTEGGPTVQTFDVNVVDDLIPESDENFLVYFTVASGYCIAGAVDEVEMSIEDNDLPGTAEASFDAAAVTYDEAEGTVTGSVSISVSSDCELEVSLDAASTMTAGSDYVYSLPEIFTFSEGGSTSQDFEITINDDIDIEDAETLILNLSVISGCTLSSPHTYTLTIVDNDSPGTSVVSFSTDEVAYDESVGTVTGSVLLSASADCEVEVNLDAASTLTEGDDYDLSLPVIFTFSEGGTTSQDFEITINDDVEVEDAETLILNLNVLSGCILGTPSTYTLTIADNDSPTVPNVDIITVTNEDADGVAIAEGAVVGLTGIVYGINLWDGGLQFTLIDETGGINVFSFDKTFGYAVTEGDEINVQGTISQFNGLTEIIPDTIIFVSSGNPLKTPTSVITLNEASESDLIMINLLDLGAYHVEDPTQWLGDGTSFNVDITNGSDTIVLRIDNNTELSTMAFEDVFYDGPYPDFGFTVQGLGTQYDTDLPYLQGYQLIPRYLSDFMLDYETNITELDQDNIRLYPNPALSSITLNMNENIESIDLTDSYGQLIQQVYVNEMQKTLDVNELPAGIYTVQLRLQNGLHTCKFIKQ